MTEASRLLGCWEFPTTTMAKRVDYSVGWTDSNQHRLKQIENAPEWRCVDHIRVEVTILRQSWTYIDRSTTLKYLMPWGMRQTMTNNYSSSSCKTFEVLPRIVRDKLQINKESYKKDQMDLTVTNSGNLGFYNLNHVYCKLCKKQNLGQIVKQHPSHFRDVNNPSIEEIMEKWDTLNLSRNLCDLVGTLIPNTPDIICGPNVRRMISHPYLHPKLAIRISLQHQGKKQRK